MSGSTIGGLVGASIGALTGNPAAVKWGFMLGSALGGVVDPDKVKGPRLDNASRPTAAEGVPIPFGYGTYPVGGHLIWAGTIVEHEGEEGGKGSGTVAVNYTYTRPYAIAFGKGEATGLQKLTRNGKLVYDISPGSTIQGQNAKFLAGCTIYLGSETQLVDPTIEAAVGVGGTSPYRGTIYIVLEDDTTERGECAQWEAVVQKCGVVSNLLAPAEPTLIFGDSEYRGRPAALGTLSGTAPMVATPFHATSADGTVLAYEAAATIAIYRWDGTGYIAQTVSGAPAPSALAVEGVAVSSDGEFVMVGSLNYDAVHVYQFNGVSTYTLVETEAVTNPRGVCFSPDGTKAAAIGGSFGGYVVNFFSFNPLTGALTYDGAVTTSTLSVQYYVDWVGSYVLASGSPGALDAQLLDPVGLTVIATSTQGATGRAFFSADADYVYQGGLVLSGSDLSLINTYSLSGSGSVHTTITKDRRYLFIGQTTAANNLWALSGATMTAVSHPTTVESAANGALFTGFGPLATWYDVPDAPGTYADEDGVLKTSYVTGTQISSCGDDLANIVADLCEQSGIEAAEYDVTDLAGIFVKGFKCAAGSGADAYIAALAQAYFFDRGEWDKKIRFVRRGGASVGSLTTDDLVRRNGPSIETTQVQEYELLRKVNVLTLNPATNYTLGKQGWERRVSTVQARGESTIELPLVASSDTTAQIAAIMGKIAWSENEKRQFALALRNSKYTPTDVVTLTDHAGTAHRIRLTSTYEEGNIFTIEEAIRDRAEVYSSNAVGTTPDAPGPTSPGLVGHTHFAALNLPQLRSSDNTSGLYIGACGMLAGWAGCRILMSVDSGLSYSVALTLTEPTTMGKLTAGCGSSGEPIRVRVFGGALENKTFLQIGLGANWAAIDSAGVAEIIAFETATPTTSIKYDLTGVYRARDDTIAAAHFLDDPFMLLSTARFLPVSQAYAGTVLYFKAVGFGISADAVTAVAVTFGGTTYIIDGGGA